MLPARFTETILLLLPAILLFVCALRQEGAGNLLLWIGTGFQLLVCLLNFASRYGRRDSVGPSIVMLYVIALGWLWIGTRGSGDWCSHLAQAILLVMPLIVFALQILTDSGAPAIRRAQALASALASRRDWPGDREACRHLPEVKALREALHVDAAPALALLRHKRAEVRIAALAALEFRQNWRPGQSELVLQLALRADEPLVRAAALAALGNANERSVVEGVAEFLRDPAWEVRRAATEAVLWDTEHHWGWIRHAVRRALGDPACQEDGPLYCDGQPLTPDAVADLTAWSGEKGAVGLRAAATLGAHYSRVLSEGAPPDLVEQLRKQLADPHAPPPLRVELARLLRANEELDADVLEQLIDPANPAPLRLNAVEALLERGDHPGARAALRDLARLPNREIALAIAALVQRRLGVDLGLPPGEPLPPIHSRQAAEVTRRVLNWATAHDQVDEEAIAAPILFRV
ncbi:MAG TPA: HEAT repeat domain-containing protein, partial [Gemmataceae bacterium]|nr:HEAT repeat domain-containing protein [Gemmataceae bacterium]